MRQFEPGVTPKERIMLLQDNAAKVEKTTYQKPLTLEDIAARREDLSDNCIKLNQFEEELKEVKDDYKLKMEPLRNHNKLLLADIKTKQTTVDGILYHIVDHPEGLMETYDSEGYFVSSRRLRPEEKQGNMFPVKKTAEQ